MKAFSNKTKKLFSSLVRPKKNYYFDYYYNNLFSKYEDPQVYLSLYQKCEDPYLKTKLIISFSKSLLFGSDIKSIKSKLGQPSYEIHHKQLNIDILLYRILIGNHKVKCQMHFFDNALFFFNYTFSYATTSEKQSILSILKNKYVAHAENYTSENISDTQNNFIIVDHHKELTINYLSLNEELYKKIQGLLTDEKGLKQKKLEQYDSHIFERL